MQISLLTFLPIMGPLLLLALAARLRFKKEKGLRHLKPWAEAIGWVGGILGRHESIRELCDNQWLFLFGINDQGKVAHKYVGNLEWETV